jgi:hypothetical protein
LRLQVECTLFCNLQSWARAHAVLVIGLYELLGNLNYLTHWATNARWPIRRQNSLSYVAMIYCYCVIILFSVAIIELNN